MFMKTYTKIKNYLTSVIKKNSKYDDGANYCCC